ncbi:putative Histone-lysine N-methyltransferase ATXR6 [Quillaja saponaria]|uniref:Histone-lysine N-methyltransferase ATXR6 n=1 Tax=Quillaja saponaria TaxID=32244 RepID=A0AAD7LJM7_QUISA|nr:putative Histone-lysine N-methyltransferase ATXR6 [Quillaja saponaria]
MASSRTPMVLRRRTQASKPLRQSPTLDDSFDNDDICCEECGSGESPAKLLLCDKCDRGYHLFCLRPIIVSVPKGSWFCPPCSKNKKPTSFPLGQTKIVDFFRIQRASELSKTVSQDNRKRKKRASSLVMSKKRRKLLPFNPSEDPERRLKQMQSANSPILEKGGMQVLSKEDSKALNLCKSMMERGECPPVIVVFDPQEGFTVEADRSIKDLTIITEYVGDVDYLKNRENDDGDSMMTLLSASDPSQTLVICPDKRSNIARFINGINNHTRDGKQKQNLKCVRYNVNGECHVLLIANRDIRKGERLYYDYNAYEQEYPTEHFV